MAYQEIFMREEDLPTCKLGKLGETTGRERRGEDLTLIISVGEGGGVEINFC